MQKKNISPYITAQQANGSPFSVYFIPESRVAIRTVRRILAGLSGKAIVVSALGPTAACKKICDSLVLMTFGDLFVNVYRHKLVPVHTIVDSTENEFTRDPDKLPKMLATDPIAIYLDLTPGTIVKIERRSLESVPYFRVVE